MHDKAKCSEPQPGEWWFVADSDPNKTRVHLGKVLSNECLGWLIAEMPWYTEGLPIERFLAKYDPWHVRLFKKWRAK